MGGAGAGQRLCFGEAPRGAHSHQRELKLGVSHSCCNHRLSLEGLTRISAN